LARVTRSSASCDSVVSAPALCSSLGPNSSTDAPHPWESEWARRNKGQGRASIDPLDPWDPGEDEGGGWKPRATNLCGIRVELPLIPHPILYTKTLGQKHRIPPRKSSREDGGSRMKEGGGEGRGGRRAASRERMATNLCSSGDEMRGGKTDGRGYQRLKWQVQTCQWPMGPRLSTYRFAKSAWEIRVCVQ
jgi:hypothetical protein